MRSRPPIPTGAGRRVRDRIPERPRGRLASAVGRPPGRRAGRRAAHRTGGVIAHVQTADGVALVDLDDETVIAARRGCALRAAARPAAVAPAPGRRRRLRLDRRRRRRHEAAARRLPRRRAHLARLRPRPPAGRSVALSPDDPDVVLYATRNRLYLSRDGGRFWRALASSCRRSRRSPSDARDWPRGRLSLPLGAHRPRASGRPLSGLATAVRRAIADASRDRPLRARPGPAGSTGVYPVRPAEMLRR